MKRTCTYLIVFASALLGAISCSKDKEDSPSEIAVSSLGFTGIDPDQGAVTLSVGDSLKLGATVSPSNATNKNVSWASGAPEVAQVGQDGTVTALATGEATLTVRAEDGSGAEASIAVRVLDTENAITSFTVNGNAATIQGNAISFSFPAGSDVDLSKLAPEIGHTGKSIAPASGVEQDFENKVVVYTVTAENGETKMYRATIDITFTAESDRAALMALYDANPDSQTKLTDWGSESPLNEWFGVTTNAEGRVTELVFDEFGLKVLPREIGDLTALKSLGLYYGELMSLPETIVKLKELEILDLEGNKLTNIPTDIGDLTALKYLYLIDNQLSSLPDGIGDLTALQVLSLSGNQLTNVPDGIGDLTALQVLSLNNNQLTGIPDRIGDLTTLEYLNLNNNQLTNIPASVCELGNSLGSGFSIDDPALCE